MGSEIKIITFWKFASFKDIFETQEDDNADKYFATNGIPASDHLSIADYDDTAFGAETLTWQDPVHSWKAVPGEVMTMENKQRIPAALIEGALALVNENILPIENSALHLRLKLMKVASTFVSNWLMNDKYYWGFLTEVKHHCVE